MIYRATHCVYALQECLAGARPSPTPLIPLPADAEVEGEGLTRPFGLPSRSADTVITGMRTVLASAQEFNTTHA